MEPQYVTVSRTEEKENKLKQARLWTPYDYEYWIMLQHIFHPEIEYNLSLLVENFFKEFYKPNWPKERSRIKNKISRAYRSLLDRGWLSVEEKNGSIATHA